jgi:glutamate formiminotransferase/glutamate formiminotransferase/formiminotetrahydrofolate cyclodeaminase
LDVHSDADHQRSVFTLAGVQGELSYALFEGARTAVERIDVGEDRDPENVGEHPHVGAVDVMPLVYLDAAQRGVACAEALVVAHEIGERLEVPVFLYGELAQGRTRAELRRGGVARLAERVGTGELRPDFGPARLHPTAGATLVAAREPLVAFNLELAAPANVEDARRIASLIREGGPEGLPGVRAIGVSLRSGGRDDGESEGGERDFEDAREHHMENAGESEPRGHGDLKSGKGVPYARARGIPFGESRRAQVSMNVERPLEVPLKAVVEVVRRHAEVTCAELVGLVPEAALEGFPEDVVLVGFDPGVHTIENALGF